MEQLVQQKVKEISEILPLDTLRIEEDLTLLEDEEGAVYALEKDMISYGRIKEDGVLAKIEAGTQLQVEKVTAKEANTKNLRSIGSTDRSVVPMD